MSLVDVHGRPLQARAEDTGLRHAHEGASRRGTFFAPWRPGLRSADADWIPDRNQAIARARDLERNDPVAASAISRRINSTVGFRWRLCAKVSAKALGITPVQARDLRMQIEAKFRPYAYGPTFSADAERKKTFGQLLRLAAAEIMRAGENVALVEWAEAEDTRFRTRLRIVDPDRLSNPQGAPDTPVLKGGIARDPASFATTGGWLREAHQFDLGVTTKSMTWRFWPRHSTPLGRPQFLHAFDELRAGQSRGVSRFVAALKKFRALSKFTDATLESAALNALVLGFARSQAGPAAISESLTAEDIVRFEDEREEYYKEHPVELDGVTLPVLPFGDEIELKTAGRDTTGFDSFTRSILRLIAAALGVTYEELSMDFSQTNYSSARAALAVAWTEVLAFRGLIKAQLADPFYLAWLEEAIDIGEVVLPPGAPDFYDAMDAYAECDWIGPGRGYIDPTKEIAAAAARIEAGISTLEKECADQGDDWEEVAEQKAFEKQRYDELGLVYPGDAGALAAVAAVAASPEHQQALDAPATR
jgi:lambda family phage portal protein